MNGLLAHEKVDFFLVLLVVVVEEDTEVGDVDKLLHFLEAERIQKLVHYVCHYQAVAFLLLNKLN